MDLLLTDQEWLAANPLLAERLHNRETNGRRAEIQSRVAQVGAAVEAVSAQQSPAQSH
jgi:hypothetical protein|eukprot:COSAG02_NODE_328_length_24547_cov_4.124141_23_plen_58_part_00